MVDVYLRYISSVLRHWSLISTRSNGTFAVQLSLLKYAQTNPILFFSWQIKCKWPSESWQSLPNSTLNCLLNVWNVILPSGECMTVQILSLVFPLGTDLGRECNDCYNQCDPLLWQYSIMWLFLNTSLSLYVPRPVSQPQYTVLHSCGALQQTHVPTFVHSLPHGIIFMPLLTLYFLHSNPMPHASPLLYVSLCMTYAHFPCHTLISPDIITSSNLTCLSI